MALSLFLDEEGVAHEVRSAGEERWALVVADADAARAEAALLAFEREDLLPAPARPPETPWASSAVVCGVVFFLSLLALQVWTGPPSPASAWFERGSADAAAILRGEWWRGVSAPTLPAA